MQSYYFVVEIYRRKQLQAVVEMDEFSRMARFVVETEQYRCKTHAECEVHVSKAFVSYNGRALLEVFNADNMDELKRVALAVM